MVVFGFGNEFCNYKRTVFFLLMTIIDTQTSNMQYITSFPCAFVDIFMIGYIILTYGIKFVNILGKWARFCTKVY